MTKSIFVSILGRPNVGKSSLLNRLVGEKVAIVTQKPQTTRTSISGIITKGDTQFVFADTPGIHKPHTKLGERMERSVVNSMADSDLAVMLFEPVAEINLAENELIKSLIEGKRKALAVINKIDTVKNKTELLEKIDELNALNAFEQILPVSAKDGSGVDELFCAIDKYAVEGPHYFSEDAYTDLPEKQLVAEIVREKILLNMQDEIPHGTAVEVERFFEREDKPIVEIDVTIYCEKNSHKGMIIGKGGLMLKKIAAAARRDCEEMLGCKVHLQCWVKVRKDWRDDENLLNYLGFKNN